MPEVTLLWIVVLIALVFCGEKGRSLIACIVLLLLLGNTGAIIKGINAKCECKTQKTEQITMSEFIEEVEMICKNCRRWFESPYDREIGACDLDGDVTYYDETCPSFEEMEQETEDED